jgi:DeoR/GlpR family transcriptional regulator of sugar metabolism
MAKLTGPPRKEPLLAESRRTAILEMLRSSGAVSVSEVQSRLGVSPMTARRDLADLASRGLAQRTHGGAVVPSLSAHEDSFALRLEAATDAKLALAAFAADRVQAGDSVYIDSSTTGYFVARRVLGRGIEVTLLTNSLPVMQMVGAHASPNVHLVAVGGRLRPLTQSFVGPYAVDTVKGHYADHTFMSVKALTRAGMMLDADELEAEVKRTMIVQAAEAVLLVDRSKLLARGLNTIAPVSDLALVAAYGVTDQDLRALRQAGTTVQTLS